MKKSLVFILSTMLIFTVGCTKFKADTSKPLIKINNSVITQKMFDDAFDAEINNASTAQKMNTNDASVYLMYKSKVLNSLITRELINQAVTKHKVVVNQEDVNKVVTDFAKSLGGEANLEKAFKEHHITREQFISNVKNELVINKLTNVEIGTKKITDNDVKAFYDKNKTKFYIPDIVRIQHIFIGVNKEAIKAKNPTLSNAELDKKYIQEATAAKVKADKILTELKANPFKFNEFAKKYSDDKVSAEKGGDIGYLSSKNMPPELSKVAFSIKKGQISDPIKSNYGYQIIKVTDFKKASIATFDQVKKDIYQYLDTQLRIKALNKIIMDTKNSSKIEYIDSQYNPELLEKKIQQQKNSK
ncbi:MAG: peptidylprolyl isomerase [Candidatus Gastranaerophilaceae bacterium]|jgi:foldase protein PrsA